MSSFLAEILLECAFEIYPTKSGWRWAGVTDRESRTTFSPSEFHISQTKHQITVVIEFPLRLNFSGFTNFYFLIQRLSSLLLFKSFHNRDALSREKIELLCVD